MTRLLLGSGMVLAIASQGCIATALGMDRGYTTMGPRVVAVRPAAREPFKPNINQAMYVGAVPGHWGSGPSIRRR